MSRGPAPELPDFIERLVPFERYTIEADGRRFHVMERGEGFPVVLLHGNPTWGFLYRRVANALHGAPLRVIMPDLQGLGFSDRVPTGDHTLENHGRWIAALLDVLELDRLVFVGQDWGGPIGLRALADRPERCAGLVLLNTVIGPPRVGFKTTAFHRFSRVPVLSEFAFRVVGFPQRDLSIAQGDRSSIKGDISRAYRYPLRGLRNNAAPLALARMVPDSMEHPSIAPLQKCQDFVEAFEGPAQIVWGDRDPVLGRVKKRVARSLPEAKVISTQAGHFLQEEVPQVIATAVREVAAAAGA